MASDLKLAVRSLIRDRGVTAVVLLFFAIGIAANSTIFSLVQAVDSPNLIYPEASRLVFLETNHAVRGLMPVSAPDASDVAAASRTLERASLTADQSSVLRELEPAQRISGRRVQPGFFEVMQVPAAQGRTLLETDGPQAFVMSDALWRGMFGKDPGVVGRSIRLDGGSVTVVGIMPERFDADADFWVAWPGPDASSPRDDRQYMVFARLKSGESVESATRELAVISSQLATDHAGTNAGWVTHPTPISRLHGRDSRGTFVLLQGAVGFVLLIACANISNILLARGTRRRHEMAVRLSLGATRRHLLRQLMTESVLLSMTGGAIGAVLSLWGIRIARAVGGFPDVIEPSVNLTVLLFTAAIAMLTGVLSGIVPAIRTSRVPPESVIRTEGARGASQSSGGLRTVLVAVQVASAIALAMGGALMLQTLTHRLDVDLGFEPEGAIRSDVALPLERYNTPERQAGTIEAMLAHLHERPEVRAAGAVTWALPTGAGGQRTFSAPSRNTVAINPGVEAVTPRYFEAMQMPSLLGRMFTEADRSGSAAVAIVNDALARQLWPGQSPVGEFLRLGGPGEAAPLVAVVGVVGSIRRSGMHDSLPPRVYLPFAQHPNFTMQVVVRGHEGDVALPLALSSALRQTDATLFAEDVRTLTEDAAQFVAPVRLMTTLLSGFGAAGLLLAALGVFATMSYTVSQRAREMAIRSALGATRRELVGMVLGKGLLVTLAGVVPGIALALLSSRALGSYLFGVSPADASTLAAVVGILLFVSLVACYRPASSAASVDPMTVLRRD